MAEDDFDEEDFERFLAWLNPNREEACKRYIEIQRQLVRIFRARGCPEIDAEECTDETIKRVIGKMPEIADTYVGDPLPYFRKVAYYVYLEYTRRPWPVPPPMSDPPDERWFKCLEHCLNQLSPDERDAVLDYYQDDGRTKIERRRKLAERLGMTVNAVRIHIYRIRETLRPCIKECLLEPAP